MKVFIKILGLIGLINCIVLYGAECKKGDFVALHLNRLETGSSSNADITTGLFDPSSIVCLESPKRRSSQDGLMQDFSKQYADGCKQDTPFEALISRIENKDHRSLARDFWNNRKKEERNQLNVAVAISPVNRSRRLPKGDGEVGGPDTQVNKQDRQTELVETLMVFMQQDLAMKEKIHQEQTIQSKQQFEASGKQTERLTRRSHRFSCAALTLTAGNIAWAIYLATRT